MGMLSIEQKYNICLMAEKHPKWTQLELARWAYQTYQLPKVPSQGTISRLLAKKNVFMNAKEHEKGANRLRKPNNLLVRRILQEWVSQSIWNGIPITPPIIQDTAQSVWHRIPSEHREGNGSFSYKWITHFLAKMDVNISNLDDELPKPPKVWTFEERGYLKQFLGKVPPKDLFTLDETFLAYNLPMDFAHYETSKIQRKIDVVTVMLCGNLDGSEKLDPLVIGRYENYNCFRNHFPNDHSSGNDHKPGESSNIGEKVASKFRLTYHSNRKSWLTSNLFHDWLVWWDKRLVVDNRKIWIILDDSCSHRIIKLRLKNIQLIYTSSNSKFLPFNWGVLDEFKTRYRVQQYEALMDLQDKLEKKIGTKRILTYDQSALTMSNAFKLIRKAWDGIPEEIIKANWKSSGILPHDMVKLNENVSMAFKKNEALEKELNNLSAEFHCVKKWDYDTLLDLNIENKNANFLSSEEIIESAIVDQWEPEDKKDFDTYNGGEFALDAFTEENEDEDDAFEEVMRIGQNGSVSVNRGPIISELIDRPEDFIGEKVVQQDEPAKNLPNVVTQNPAVGPGAVYHSVTEGPTGYFEDVFTSLASDANASNPVAIASQLGPSTGGDSLSESDLLGFNTNDLSVNEEFSLSSLNDYLNQAATNPASQTQLNNQRLLMLTTLQTNLDIAKSMGNILKHAEVREVGLSDRTLDEMKSSYQNCLKKIRKAKHFLNNSSKKQPHQRLDQRILIHQQQHRQTQLSAMPQSPNASQGQANQPSLPSMEIGNNAFFNSFPPNSGMDIASSMSNSPENIVP